MAHLVQKTDKKGKPMFDKAGKPIMVRYVQPDGFLIEVEQPHSNLGGIQLSHLCDGTSKKEEGKK
ncbi:MAG: hypothetical protein AAB778_03760 [Patescibacteria group bacterium]